MPKTHIIICEVCGQERCSKRPGKYCSIYCSRVAARGRPNPHSAEWEAKRIAAVRTAGSKRKGVKTGPRSPEFREKMRSIALKYHQENKERANKTSISNLPKNTSGEKNGNWKGGLTAEKRGFYRTNSYKIKKWREAVFERDGRKCKDCGSTERLECHHIMPLVSTKEFAFDRANGVTLCRECHKKTESWCGKGSRGKIWRTNDRRSIVIMTIPHRWQDYDTLGNWRIGTAGSLLIFVSENENPNEEFLIGLHEMIEAFLCLRSGVTTKQVDDFDMAYHGGAEPGDEPNAPYRRQHRFAMLIEHLMARELGVEGYGRVE